MKFNFRKSAAGVVAGLVTLAGASVAQAQSEVVNVLSTDVFVPVGFDDNDDVTVVLDGYLPSSCYKLEKAVSTINPETKKVTLQQTARKWPGPCLLSLVPYTSVVNLGMLPVGEFSVVANDGNLRDTLNVTEATSAGPDEYLYAPVDSVNVSEVRTPGNKFTATIEGRFTDSCMSMDSVKVINSGKTIEVLPIMKMAAGPVCMPVIKAFKKVVKLPTEMELGRHLVHVRSLNGKSVNAVFSVSDDQR